MAMARIEFSEIGPPWWDDKPTIIIATAPSLENFDFDKLRRLDCHFLGIKEAGFALDFVDEVITLDLPWLRRRRDALSELAARKPVWAVVPDEPEQSFTIVPNVRHLRRVDRLPGLALNDTCGLRNGLTSGFVGLNYAVMKRSRLNILLGFDYAAEKTETGYKHHASRFDYYWTQWRSARYWQNWSRTFDPIPGQLEPLGIKVYNASPRSNITAFPMIRHDYIEELVGTYHAGTS